MSTRSRNGFTLVEILIVVIILGIIAAMVIPSFGHTSREVEQTSFVTDLNMFVESAKLYIVTQDQLLPDGATGVVPAGWTEYIDTQGWTRGTPIGGDWDVETNDSGITCGVGVHFNGVPPKPDDYMAEIDSLFDDGDLTAGCFQKIAADRFYYIILP